MLNQDDIFALPYLIKIGEMVGSQLTEEEAAVVPAEIIDGYSMAEIAKAILQARAFHSVLKNQMKMSH